MPLNVLIVGGGSIGERHLRCFQQQPGVVVALCESNEARRGELRDRYRLTEVFAEIEAAMASRWDAAVICTPANLHVPQALRLLPSAEALLIEKPLSTVSVPIDHLIEQSVEKVVGVAYTWRSHPAVRLMRQWVQNGELGSIYEAVVSAGSYFPKHRPAYASTYYANRETGGGAIQDAATHLFDLTHFLVGRFDWVFCDAAHQILPHVNVEDTVHVTARANGEQTMVTVSVNQFMAPYEIFMQLNGDAASARIELHADRCGMFRHSDTDWNWTTVSIQDRDDLFREQARSFLSAAAGKCPVSCSLDDAAHSLEINRAALRSAVSGEVVWLEGRHTSIVHDPANARSC